MISRKNHAWRAMMSAWANQKPRSVHRCGGDLLLVPRHSHSSDFEHNVADAQTALAAGHPDFLIACPFHHALESEWSCSRLLPFVAQA